MQDENVINPEVPQEVENRNVPETKTEEVAPNRTPFFVFNFNTLLALLLLAGLAVLYLLHFSAKKADDTLPISVSKSDGKSISVVFVNLDTLNTHYEFVKVLKRDLEGTGKRLQNEVLAEQSALEKEAADFQKQIAANAITEEKAKVVYEQLMQKQQSLMEKKERYTQMVAEQELSMNIRLVDTVTNFLKRFNRQYRFDYIMGYKSGGEILVSNDTLDITRNVLDALNGEYSKRKK